MTGRVEPERDIGLQGHYAGFVTRLAAFALDVLTIVIVFSLAGRVLEYLISALSGERFLFSDAPIASVVLLVLWVFFYFAYPLAMGGRTLGMAIVGLRVVRTEGSDLDGRHAVLRVLVFPLSFLVLGIGFLLVLIRRDRCALHDLIAKTAVVYAWDARAAHLRFLARRGAQ